MWNKIKSAGKKLLDKAKNVFSGGKNQTASVGNVASSSGKSNVSSASSGISGVPAGISFGTNTPVKISADTFSATGKGGGLSAGSLKDTSIAFANLAPKTISSGKQPTGGSGSSGSNILGGFTPTGYDMQTISSFSMGGAGAGSLAQTGGGSTSSVVMPSNPGSVNPSLDTTALAGRTAGLYERQDDGSFKEVSQEDTAEDKAQKELDLFNKFVGEMPGVEDDREVREAREQRRQIQEMLRGPTNELNAVIAKQNADLLAHRQMVSQSGGTETGFGGIESAINYNAAIRALPLQASIASLQGDLELATDYLTELRQVKSDQIKRQYEYRKSAYEAVKGVLDKEDERAYKEKVTENERAYKEEQKLVDFQNELSMMVMQNAPESVRTNIINRVNAAPTIQDAIQAAGRYGVPQNTEIRQLANGETVVIDKNTNKIVSNLGGAKSTAVNTVGLTPEQASDPFIKKLADSAGGKPLTDTFAQKLDKGLTVLGQIGVLQNNIQDVKTGPIAGLFKGANPWDTNAQTIKAQLNAIVPNLARGVYGEVGVLTDNDIATYAKTLPNLRSTEDIRNAVLGITVDLISKSIKRTLEVNAANGKDVSGFIDLYTEMQSTRDNIFSQIPGYTGNTSQANVTPEIQSLRSKYDY